MTKENINTILDVSHKYGLSHLGSNFSALPILEYIYEVKREEDAVVLSSGHAGIAQYAVLESKYHTPTAEQMFLEHGIHPERCKPCRLDVTTGSLGQGLTVGLGMALADSKKDVYAVISDGEAQEGVIWEALRIKTEERVDNLHIFANLNHFGAYKDIDSFTLARRLKAFDPSISINISENILFPFLYGQSAHYLVMSDNQYELAKDLIRGATRSEISNFYTMGEREISK